MRRISIFLLLIGLALTVFGMIPYVFSFPYNAGPYSGPANFWELVVMVSYNTKGWSSFTGIFIFLVSLLVQKKTSINYK